MGYAAYPGNHDRLDGIVRRAAGEIDGDLRSALLELARRQHDGSANETETSQSAAPRRAKLPFA